MKKLLLSPLLLLTGCVAATFYTVQIPMTTQMDNTNVVAAAVSTFQDNGFTIALANDKVCAVTTDAKTLSLTGGERFSKIMLDAAHVRTVKLLLTGNTQGKDIKINPIIQEIHETEERSGTPITVTPNERELKLIKKVSEELAAKLNIQPNQIEITSYQEGT